MLEETRRVHGNETGLKIVLAIESDCVMSSLLKAAVVLGIETGNVFVGLSMVRPNVPNSPTYTDVNVPLQCLECSLKHVL